MTYAADRRLLDADSHIMELPDFLSKHADPGLRDRLPPIDYTVSSMKKEAAWRLLEAGGHDREYAAQLEALGGEGLIRGPKEEKAPGAARLHGRWRERARARDFSVMHHAPERFLSCMVVDGVFERFPRLRGASVELGAGWAPALLDRLDDLAEVFGRSEPALRAFARKPSEQLREQVAFTPYVFEDVARLIDRSSADLYLFSSDYPHAEGGRNPIGRFEQSLAGVDAARCKAFWSGNFERVFERVM